MTMRRPLYFTLSDANFSPRAFAMLKSLREFDSISTIFLFVIGEISPNLRIEFEKIHVEIKSVNEILPSEILSHVQNSRSYLSTLWTYPALILDREIEKKSDWTDIVYLDADLYFFGSPEVCWKEIPQGNIAIVRHNFSERLAELFPDSGEFNVSWVSMPVNDIGRKCARKWAEECYSLCPDTPIQLNGRTIYGDQRYLDTWPTTFKNSLTILENPGIGLAPWNFENYEISPNRPWTVDGKNLIFYHFSSHQFGFKFARRMGRTYSQVSEIPIGLYKEYENQLKQSVKVLGMASWKSRYVPFPKRVLDYCERIIRNS